jgi:hypothetical protein
MTTELEHRLALALRDFPDAPDDLRYRAAAPPAWRRTRLPTAVGLGLAAAVLIVAVAAVVARHASSPSPPVVPIRPPATSQPPPPWPGPADRAVHNGPLRPGRYAFFNVDGTASVAFTVPVGWSWHDRTLSKGGASISFYGGRVQVYRDPCHWASTSPARPTGQTVNDLMAALTAQAGRSASTPRFQGLPLDQTNPRWEGMIVELTIPANLSLAGCDGGQFRTWGPRRYVRPGQGPGQRDVVWAVDVLNGLDDPTGRVIVDVSSSPGTPRNVTAEIDSILRTTWIGHWG